MYFQLFQILQRVSLYGTAVVAHWSIYGTVRIFGDPMVNIWHCRNKIIRWWLTGKCMALQPIKIYNLVAIFKRTHILVPNNGSLKFLFKIECIFHQTNISSILLLEQDHIVFQFTTLPLLYSIPICLLLPTIRTIVDCLSWKGKF